MARMKSRIIEVAEELKNSNRVQFRTQFAELSWQALNPTKSKQLYLDRVQYLYAVLSFIIYDLFFNTKHKLKINLTFV